MSSCYKIVNLQQNNINVKEGLRKASLLSHSRTRKDFSMLNFDSAGYVKYTLKIYLKALFHIALIFSTDRIR